MALQIETVTKACKQVSRQVRETYNNLHIHYIVHHEGQRREAFALAAQEIIAHPAAENAIHLLQRVRRSEESAMLGTAIAHKSIFFGLASQTLSLSLCTINLEQFESAEDANRYAWHLAWHAIDTMLYQKSHGDQSDSDKGPILRRRNALEMAQANLRADVFSTIMATLNGDTDSIQKMAVNRGISALNTRSMHNPEFYPFVLSKEATEFAIKELLRKDLPARKFIETALKTADNINKTIDESGLQHWLAFSEPAQDMAWRGFSKEEILGAAINTSEDTHVRATGYLISEITGLHPKSMIFIQENYSSFANDAFNKKLHEKAVNTIFEDVIAQGLRDNSAAPFIRLANSQNESLTEGHVLGWCASALQAAGNAYQKALETGAEPEEKAREKFAGECRQTEWEDLRALGKKVVRHQRHGEIITMSMLDKICSEDKGLGTVRRAIQTTMKDPSYKNQLAAAQELEAVPRLKTPAPAAPQPTAAPTPPVPQAPSAPGLGGLGLGGGGGYRRIPPQTQTQTQATNKEQATETGETTRQ